MSLSMIIGLLMFGAIVTGPLFSLTASGQIGKALVYSTWKGRAYVREYVIGANPNTLEQRVRRAMMSFLSKWWAGLDSTEKSSWDSGASAKSISPFNEMVSVNMDRQTNNQGPTGNSTPAGGSLTGTIAAGPVLTSPIAGQAKVVITNTVNLGADEYNFLTISDVSFADSQSLTNFAAFGVKAISDNTLTVDGLEPGTYFLGVGVLNEGGTVSTIVTTSPASIVVN